jgi:hypothetical protein
MALAVVDVLEVVQIHEQQHAVFTAALKTGNGVGQPVLEQAPVGQPGELVVVRQVVQVALRTHLRHWPATPPRLCASRWQRACPPPNDSRNKPM